MEIYDRCTMCNAYDGLVNWRKTALVCIPCYRKLETRAPYWNGRRKTNEEAFLIIKAENLSGA